MKKHAGALKMSSFKTLPDGFLKEVYEELSKDSEWADSISLLQPLVLCQSLPEFSSLLEEVISSSLDGPIIRKFIVKLLFKSANGKLTNLTEIMVRKLDKVYHLSDPRSFEFSAEILSHISGHCVQHQRLMLMVKCLTVSPPEAFLHRLLHTNLSLVCQPLVTLLTRDLDRLFRPQTPPHMVLSVSDKVDMITTCHNSCQLLYQLLQSDINPANFGELVNPGLGLEVTRELNLCLREVMHSELTADQGYADLTLSVALLLVQLSIYLPLKERSLKDLVVRRENPLSQCSIMYGIVTCKRTEKLVFLWSQVSTMITHMMASDMTTVTLHLFMKLVNLWTANWNKTLDPYSDGDISPLIPLFHTTFSYVQRHWEHTSEPIRLACRDTYASLIRVMNEKKALIESTLETLLCYPWTRKGKYGFLVVYINLMGCSGVLSYYSQTFPSKPLYSGSLGDACVRTRIVLDMFRNLSNQQFANYIGDLLSVFLKHDEKPELQAWVKAIIQGFHHAPACHDNFSKYLLPKLSKTHKQLNSLLLSHLSNSQHNESPSSDSHLQLMLMLTRHARNCGSLVEGENDGLWCGILDKTVLEKALKNHRSEVRLAAFALVCIANKTTTPILDYEFEWVLDFVNTNMFHEEPSFRQQALSSLKHFFYHMLESGRKLHPEATQYQDFIDQLYRSQRDQLTMTSLPSVRSAALEVFQLLMNILPHHLISATKSHTIKAD